MDSSSQKRCVFVGNIPYDATEEQLIDICREVGPVVSFRLVIDRETGKPKGYGFCEYKDEETALSARRNLQGYEINGRQLRVDFAENDKNAERNREQGRGGPGLTDPQKQVGGPAILGESFQHQPIGLHLAITAANVMAGALGGVQTGMHPTLNGMQNQPAVASDPLTLHLAKMSRSQLMDAMHGLKAMATQNKEQAHQLLLARPQLTKALFQAQIMLGMVNPQVLLMPNIRQPTGQPAARPQLDAQQGQLPAVQTLPGLPSQTISSGMVPKMHDAQLPPLSQNPLLQNQFSGPLQQIQIRSQIPPHPNTNIPRQSILPGQSGVPPIRPVHTSLRPQIPIVTSSVNQQTPPSLLQHTGQLVGTATFGRTSQNPNVPIESSVLPRPLPTDAVFQPGPSTLSGISNDSKDPNSRPSKLFKLDDGRGMSFSSSALNVSTPGPTHSFAVSSVPVNPLPTQEELRNPEKQGSQLPPDVESALLQQVLNLTPEQLNSLPPDQRQQVIQLQQALRQEQI